MQFDSPELATPEPSDAPLLDIPIKFASSASSQKLNANNLPYKFDDVCRTNEEQAGRRTKANSRIIEDRRPKIAAPTDEDDDDVVIEEPLTSSRKEREQGVKTMTHVRSEGKVKFDSSTENNVPEFRHSSFHHVDNVNGRMMAARESKNCKPEGNYVNAAVEKGNDNIFKEASTTDNPLNPTSRRLQRESDSPPPIESSAGQLSFLKGSTTEKSANDMEKAAAGKVVDSALETSAFVRDQQTKEKPINPSPAAASNRRRGAAPILTRLLPKVLCFLLFCL